MQRFTVSNLSGYAEPHLDPQRGIPGLYAPRRRLALS